VQPAAANDWHPDIDNNMRLLSDPDQRIRAEAVIQLGRLKAYQAIDAVAATLASDTSPTVREAAARALGLIGSAKAFPVLRQAALTDADNEVRRSAQFAAEVVKPTR
jgi:HEAT repeat protein